MKREEGEEKSERKREEKKIHDRWAAMIFWGRPNLPWRLDGKPPTAMWVRTNAEDSLPMLLGRFLREWLVRSGN